MLAETGYTGSTDPHDPHRQMIDGRLLNEFPGIDAEHRQIILETGKSPYKIAKRDGRHGWFVKVKGGASASDSRPNGGQSEETIVIERYVTGKRDDRQTMLIPLADWPTTTRPWRPNLAHAQNEVLWQTVTAMVKRVFAGTDITKSENIIQITKDCDNIRGKIRERVADVTEETPSDEDGLIILRRSALRDLVAQFDALRAEVETLRKETK
jgi:hypothetical protein